jgi:hypothetical protein
MRGQKMLVNGEFLLLGADEDLDRVGVESTHVSQRIVRGNGYVYAVPASMEVLNFLLVATPSSSSPPRFLDKPSLLGGIVCELS